MVVSRSEKDGGETMSTANQHACGGATGRPYHACRLLESHTTYTWQQLLTLEQRCPSRTLSPLTVQLKTFEAWHWPLCALLLPLSEML